MNMEVSWTATTADQRSLWLAMGAIYAGALIVSIDATVVNIAIPSIARDLHFYNADLTWLANAYLSTYGGLMLIAGRLGDVLGQRRIFVFGILLFTVASLGCGMASAPWALITGRAIQGTGGAITSTATLALVRNVFPDSVSRARAMGIFTLIAAAGSVLGVVAGGMLTGLGGWHWIFFINVPIGIGVAVACLTLIPDRRAAESAARLDIGGAVTITASLLLANYALVMAPKSGWIETGTLCSLGISGVFFTFFIYIERRAENPIFPLRTFGLHNIVPVSIVGALLSAALLSWTFVSSFYLQSLLQFTPIQAGAAYLPLTVSDAVVSIAVVPALIKRFGLKPLTVLGALVMSAGIFMCAMPPTHKSYLLGVLSGMGVLGVGMGLAYGPLLLSVLNATPQSKSGMVSGVISTSWIFGGTLGFAVLVGALTGRSADFFNPGADVRYIQTSGYHAVFYVSAMIVAATAAISGLFVRSNVDELQRDEC